jgi:hypothetical protein
MYIRQVPSDRRQVLFPHFFFFVVQVPAAFLLKATPKSMKNPMRLQNIDDHLFGTEICSYSWTPPSTACAISELQEALLPSLEDMDPNLRHRERHFSMSQPKTGGGESLLVTDKAGKSLTAFQ